MSGARHRGVESVPEAHGLYGVVTRQSKQRMFPEATSEPDTIGVRDFTAFAGRAP